LLTFFEHGAVRSRAFVMLPIVALGAAPRIRGGNPRGDDRRRDHCFSLPVFDYCSGAAHCSPHYLLCLVRCRFPRQNKAKAKASVVRSRSPPAAADQR